jgi:hypothetical protein
VAFFDHMPLDSDEHVRAAWHLVTGLEHRARRHLDAGEPPPPFTPGPDEIRAAKDRIQFAAIERGLGYFPEPPAPGPPPGLGRRH